VTVDTPTRVVVLRYDLGELVYHRLATERRKGMITGISIAPDGVLYLVTWSDRCETRHFECELTSEFVPDYEASE
jgi:hypothetical protein